MLKNGLVRAVSAIVAAVMLLLVGVSSGELYDVKAPEECLLDFSVLSDCHIESNNFMRYRVFAQALRDVRRNRSGNDAVLFLGDSTMNGQHLENMLFHGTVAALLKKETVLPVLGNHDIGNGEGDYAKLQNRWYTYTSAFFGRTLSRPYYCEVIDGFYFIVLGMEAQKVYEMYMSDAQFRWLEDVLAQAADSGKPVFVFSHYPTDDVVDANGETTGRLTEMLASFNRTHDLFCFVGHTHMPMHLQWSFHTYDGFPQTYLPRLTSLGGSKDNKPIENTGVGLVVEVYGNEVVLRARDFYRSAWKTEDDETPCAVTYALKNAVSVS